MINERNEMKTYDEQSWEERYDVWKQERDKGITVEQWNSLVEEKFALIDQLRRKTRNAEALSTLVDQLVNTVEELKVGKEGT